MLAIISLKAILNGVGIFGVILLLIGFFLLEQGALKSHDKPYLLLNLFGSAGILVSLYTEWNLPAFIIESAWMLISFYGFFHRPKTK